MATEVTTNAANPGANALPPATPSATPAQPAAQGEPKPGATANPPVEAGKDQVVEPPKEPKQPDDPMGGRFAALTRREQKVVEREKQVKAQEKDVGDWKKARENAKLDPIALLEAHGLSYDDVSQFVLNDKKLTDAQRLAIVEERIKKDEEKRQNDAKEAEERNTQKTLDAHLVAINEHVEQGGDTYELIASHGAQNVVQFVIQQHYEATYDEATGVGEILSIPAACKAVEDHLEKEAREKVLKLKRFQPKPDGKTEAEPKAPPATGAQPETPRPAPTLTNGAVTSTPSPDSRKDLSDEESLSRSASMLRWT